MISVIEELVSLVSLDNIVFHEERARRIAWEEGDPKLADLPSYANSLGIQQSDQSLTFRFRMVFTDENAEYVADIAAVYAVTEPLSLGQDLFGEFAERVAFMTVYPFLRSSVYGSAARLGQPIPVLGLVRPGEFHAAEQMSEEDVRGAFLDNVSESVGSK